MRIGIDCHNLEGNRTGVARYLINLLKHWEKMQSHSSSYGTMEFFLYFKNEIPDDINNILENKNFQNKILKSKSPALPVGGNALFVHYFLPRAAKKDKVDILFCPGYVAPIFYRGKLALTLHDIIYEARADLYEWPSIFDKILLKKVSKISAKKAKIIFTCSKFSKEEIIKHYKVDSKKIFAIPLAADEKFKNVGGLASHIKRRKFIFYVGAIIKRRFVHETIKAFKKFSDELPNYKFLIIGKNHTGMPIEGDNIIYKENVNDDDLLLLYNTTDLFIWLSEYEGFGLPPLEAMACGTPVLSTKKTSLAEVLGDYPVWVENPKDINEISKKMFKILSDDSLRDKMIKGGLEQSQKFSWGETAEKTLQALIQE